MTDERWNPTPSGWTPTPSRTPHPRECVFEFVRASGQTGWRCELVDDGEFGIDAQIFRNEEFSDSIRFPSKPFALAWADSNGG